MNREAEDLQGLREAFAVAGPPEDPEQCPPPERIWAALRGELSAGEIRDVVDHTATCASCAEDWRLAAALLVGEENKVPAVEKPIAVRVRGAAAPLLRPQTRDRRPWYAFAAAALVLVAVGLSSPWWKQSPSVPRDGSRATIESALGPDPVLPRNQFELRWRDIAPGARYEVEVSTEEGFELIATGRGLTQPKYKVPPDRLTRLPSGTLLLWNVVATLPEGGGKLRSETFKARLE